MSKNKIYEDRKRQVGKKWKGGKMKRKDGYIDVSINGEVILEHRHVMEAFLGKKLERNDTVHHRNGDRQDNRLKNLEVMTNSEHVTMHMLERWANR